MADHPDENLPQLIARLKAHYKVNEPEIAAAIGVSVSTVNTWASGKRGGKRGPRPENLEALADAYRDFSRERIFAAAQRLAPGPPDADAEARVLKIYRALTEEQRDIMETQWRAVAEKNHTGQ